LNVLVARYYVQAGRGDEVAAALKEMAALVKEREPECVLYEVSRSEDDLDEFLLYERYRDAGSLEAHRETPHFKRIVEGRILPLLVRRERTFYTYVGE
jgi:autoinducer 2-degrading protein